MSVRFGVSPIAWINDDMPEIGADTPLEQVLRDARDIGFTGIELGGRFPRDPAALSELLQRHGLDLIGGWYSASLLTRTAKEEIEALQPHLALLKAMGSTVFIQAETSNAIHSDKSRPLRDCPRLPKENWDRFGERLTEVADYIASQGFSFAYHHHLGTLVERPEDLELFLKHSGPNVGLTVDTGHAMLGGLDPVQVIRQAPERVAHVHCKDIRTPVFADLMKRGGSFLDGVLDGMFTVPGDGEIDYGAVMRALADTGYSGWIVIEAEQDPKKADPRRYGQIGLDTIRQEAASAGLEEAA